MKKALPGLVLGLTTISPFVVAEEDRVRYIAGVGFGVTELSFDEKLDTDPSFNMWQVFGSALYRDLYASVSYADTISDENVSEEDETGDVSRKDFDLTLGYRISDSWTGFVGYKDGETSLDLRVRDTDVSQDEYYREDGFFAGLTYSHPIRNAGTLSFTAAYILFDSDLKFTEGFEDDEEEEDEEDEELEFDDLEGKYSGDATGYSIGVSWVIPVGTNFAFRAQYKLNQYDLEVKAEGKRFEPEQRLVYFDVGLVYLF